MKVLSTLIACVMLALIPAGADAASAAAGIWRGALQTPDGELSLIVRISEDAGGVRGTLDSPDQQVAGIPLKVTESGPARLAFQVPAIEGGFAGAWNESQQAWSGAWSQSGIELPLVLRKSPPAVTTDPVR